MNSKMLLVLSKKRDIDPNLIAYWKFLSSLANDGTSNKPLAVTEGVEAYRSDRYGNPNASFSFNGATKLEESTLYKYFGDGYTWNFWCYSDVDVSAIFKELAIQWDGRLNGNGLYCAINNGNLIINTTSQTTPNLTTPLNPYLVWKMVTITLAENDLNVYIDGVFKNGTSNFNIGDASSPLKVGKSGFGTGREWNGGIDDFRVYDKILTQAEITALYNE